MSVQWIGKGRRRWIALLAAVIAALPQLFFPLVLPKGYPMVYPMLLAVVLGGFAVLVFGLRFEIRAWWGLVLEQLCVAGASAFIIHLPMYARSYAALMALVYTALIALTLQMLAFALTGNGKWFGALWLTVCWIYGIVNFEIFEFTGNMISLSQIMSVRTAVNVMGSYHFVFGPYIISATILYILSMIALMSMRETGLRGLRVRLIAVACAVAAALLPARGYTTLKVRNWKSNAMYLGIGIPLELLLEYRSYQIRPPEGYSREAASGLAAYGSDAKSEVRPHVIAIMFEAFSDLSVLGDLKTNMDPMPYTRSLYDESIHGSYLASTLAGGTSRTEWEFLTGNSLMFLPGDVIPFKQFVSGEQNSIVRAVENQGYHTIGMHCFDGSGWDRYRVYPLMGFDEVYFEEDLKWDGRVRKYISDSAFVHQVIQRFEARQPDVPLFLFGVSMQNHGGYDEAGFEADVHVQGLDVDCSQEDQYLSLVKLTDDAIRELVEYFRGQEEPVELVFFGDHQPGLTKPFYDALGVDLHGFKYIVPYVIWKNYDSTPEETPMTSANFLAARTLKEAGLALPPYFGFLDTLSETVPAVCGLGYQYGGEFYSRDDIADETAGAWLDEYAIYQYANVFDPDADDALYQGAAAP